ARAELARAASGSPQVVRDGLPERRAVEGAGEAGPAEIDEQQVAPVHQRSAQLEVVAAAVGRRVAGSAFDADHRPERGPRAVAAAVELELDPDRLPRRRPIERHADDAAA